ncbi:hypothetical protein GCM10007047_29570 [Cerasicoccus arenae]|uniref:Uncharacterized protein n=1 Tax=Cerasicoccus arenae TaxID=424488 RepID=A0A8J3DEN4_9BACT|nr:hypothetical protein GCM10007047_29570 [Cerasicoccus arenae]
MTPAPRTWQQHWARLSSRLWALTYRNALDHATPTQPYFTIHNALIFPAAIIVILTSLAA